MHKNNDTFIGCTIEETQMKLSSEGNFPIFEIHHNGTKSTIEIVCFSDNKTSFILDSISTESINFKHFVSMKKRLLLIIMMEHLCKN